MKELKKENKDRVTKIKKIKTTERNYSWPPPKITMAKKAKQQDKLKEGKRNEWKMVKEMNERKNGREMKRKKNLKNNFKEIWKK